MAKNKPSDTAKPGALVVLPPSPGPIPKGALAAVCDGCGAEVWILDKPDKSRVFCVQCLQARKIM